jgi:hypothetical protein
LSGMAAVLAAIRANNRRPKLAGVIDAVEDPYAFITSHFPARQDRVIDKVLGKLMLDG